MNSLGKVLKGELREQAATMTGGLAGGTGRDAG